MPRRYDRVEGGARLSGPKVERQGDGSQNGMRGAAVMVKGSDPCPATLAVDFADWLLDKLTTFFRPFVAIPSLVIFALLGGGS